MYYVISLINDSQFYYKSEIEGQMFLLCESQPGLSGNPFLWLEKRGQKD